jgi:hypothetical protein
VEAISGPIVGVTAPSSCCLSWTGSEAEVNQVLWASQVNVADVLVPWVLLGAAVANPTTN